MGFVQAYKMAIKSIGGNKIRSFLTMLGVIIGVAAVISAVAFAQGSTKKVTDQIQSLGSNLIQITITGRNSNREIKYEELKRLEEENSEQINAIAPQINGSITIKYGVRSRQTSVHGTTPEFEEIKSTYTQSGRFILQQDIDYLQRVAILGTAVVNDLFEEADPIGQLVKINGQVFRVIGVLEEKANGQEKSADDQVLIPITVAQRMMKSATINNFTVQAATPDDVEYIMEILNTFLLKRYKNTNAFRVFNQAEALSALNEVTGTMMRILGGIATISLMVGGIGIMNIMLVSVTERTREIGIRKAIGAKKRNILIQFLIEALMITGLGGLMGISIGLSIIRFLLGGLKIVPEVYSFTWMVLSFGISLMVGVIFGIFPAIKASNLSPIEALRHE